MFEGTSKEDTNAIAKTLANLSQHPVSRAICKALPAAQLLETKESTFLPGQGTRSKIGEHTYYLGSRALVSSIRSLKDTRHQPTGSEVWLAGPGVLARFVLREEIRTESKKTLTALHAMGIRTVMLTGDRKESAEQIGKTLGVQEIRAHLSPEQKVAAIEELKNGGTQRVAMIGDGVNDAPCIAAADVGAAMGARGSDAALEQAEIVLMNDRLEQFVLAYQLSRKSKRVVYQNVSIALGTVSFMVAAAFFFPVPLALGVAAHEGSTLLVVLNSLRLLRTK
jgi:Cd2+/Zn2+-exporting ATPase